MEIVEKDLLSVSKGIIVHSVNCRGVMGAGLAKQIRERYPEVYKEYRRLYRLGKLKLGTVFYVPVAESLWVANLAGQDDYGITGVCHSDYQAFRAGFTHIRTFSEKTELPVYLPYGIGCGLGGGDWSRMLELIEELLPDTIVCIKK